jgi:hypothetical protein
VSRACGYEALHGRGGRRADDRRQNKQYEAVYAAFEQGQWSRIVHEGSPSLAGGSVFKVSAACAMLRRCMRILYSQQSSAPTSERNLLSIYSSTVQGLKANVSNRSHSVTVPS